MGEITLQLVQRTETYTSDNTAPDRGSPRMKPGDRIQSQVGAQSVVRFMTLDGRIIEQVYDYIYDPEPQVATVQEPGPKRPITEVMADRDFIEGCIAGKVEPSRRQAAKFRNRQGKAWLASEEIRLRILNAPCGPVFGERAPRPADDEEV